jgi:hypothetical protein
MGKIMSRLLFAAARGARIGWQTLSGQWCAAFNLLDVQSEGGQVAYRIHPDDAHLQYGPVSTALREMAEDPKHNSSWEQFLANSAANEFTESFDSRRGECDYPLFYLFLAEFLADSGL